MQISNFTNKKTIGSTYLDRQHFAQVTVTTGWWFWKKSTVRNVTRKAYQTFWSFTDTGKFTPDYDVETLEKAYDAQQLMSQ